MRARIVSGLNMTTKDKTVEKQTDKYVTQLSEELFELYESRGLVGQDYLMETIIGEDVSLFTQLAPSDRVRVVALCFEHGFTAIEAAECANIGPF